MTTTYNAVIELDEPAPDEARATVLVDALIDYHPAVGRSLLGRLEIIMTLPAETLHQAVTTAMAVAASSTGAAVHAVEVLPTADFDRLHGLQPVPEMVSVTEAANLLGVSRQAVLQRIDSGSLPAERVGTAWILPRAAVAQAHRRATVDMTDRDAREYVVRAIEAGEASAGEFDVDAIVAELYDRAGGYDFDVLEHDDFWEVVARHAR